MRSRTAAVPGRLVLVGLAALGTEALIYAVAVWTPLGQAYDDRVISGWRISHPGAEVDAARALATVGLPWVAILAGLLIGVALVRGRPRLGVGLAIMIGGATATAEALKHLVLPRPVLGESDPILLGSNSFPSGHVTVAAVLAAALVCVAPSSIRGLATLVGLGYSVLLGAAALFLGWHRPSDIAGGYLTAIVWAALVCGFLAGTEGGDRGPAAKASGSAHVARDAVLSSLAATVAVAIAYLLIRRHELATGAVALTRAFWTGIAMIALTATIALVVLSRALRGVDLR